MKKRNDAIADVRERAKDVLAGLSLEEKIAQLQCMVVAGDDPAAALAGFKNGLGEVSALSMGSTAMEVAESNKKIVETIGNGLPPILHTEAITGVSMPQSTVFPSAIGLGATFATETIEKMADIIRLQMLAVGFRQALSPVMDVCRDPRWGRIGETYGEDPTLCAAMSVAFTKGLQGTSLSDGVVATGKHFLGFGFSEGGLNMASNPIPSRELREVYAKPFQAAISEAGLQAIMNSYGVIDGELIIGSREILTGLLREEMGFEGIVVSDYMSIEHLVDRRLAPDMAAAGRQSLEAGLDVECPLPNGFTHDALVQAVTKGELDEAVIDRAVLRVLETKLMLGLPENPLPRTELFDAAFNNPDTRAHSLKAAREATVLLKNDGLLPLSRSVKRIAVIGPHAESIRMLFGGYTFPAGLEMALGRSMGEMAGMSQDFISLGGDGDFVPAEPFPGSTVIREHPDAVNALKAIYGKKTPTILEAIQAKCPTAEVVYTKGCDVAGTDTSGFEEAARLARESDVVILTVGGKYGWGANCTIGEGIDSDTIGPPGVQEALAKAIYAANPRSVLVHMDARPLSSVFIAENYPAILEYWFPGITGGEALADILFGDYNPAGRLPATCARHVGQLPIFSAQYIGNGYHTSNTNNILNRYCDGTKEPLFYFGHGLSYSRFAYSGLQVTSKVSACGTVQISCRVKNIGTVDGDEVVQLYVSDMESSMVRPEQELAGFARVHLKAGEECGIRFTLRADQFAFVGVDMNWVVEEGIMKVRVGGASNVLPLEGEFYIEDTAPVVACKRGFFAKYKIQK